MKKCALMLPSFELLKRQPRIPNVARKIASTEVPNKYGTLITYTVKQSRNRKSWWLFATLNDMRMSNTVHTTKPDLAEKWLTAIKDRRVCLKDEDQ